WRVPSVGPPGVGAGVVTPVSVLGPLFVTTIVHVMLPARRSCVAGEPAVVIERSTRAWTQVEALALSEPSLLVVTLPVLSTVPLPGQSPPVAAVVPDTTCTVNVEAAAVVPAGTVTPSAPPQDRTPAEIEQLESQPAPCEAIDQDRPGLVGRGSFSITPRASPSPEL